ncbi:hypothetical protein D3P07_21260 [Paenibacillus sp. 1011MAR3C5]|uniref:hypothetical protein n=1 Tax=Paenibacillus sp. 1011MAR3C5 TaxID=1675787 RepID=UPI000E6B52D5|nr:hypothetical protein [Paenibacillus sp. 1011MAR3C5]RJE85102.1 hypothetical protein D3P07_21260 [Paenibacillus sp. 1011MAR3C5]
MRAIILYVFIIVSVVAMGMQSSEQPADAQMTMKHVAGVPLVMMPAIYDSTGHMNHAEEASMYLQTDDGEPASEPPQPSEESIALADNGLDLDSVNGISLYDNPEAVVSKLGEPVSKSVDEIWGDLAVYAYPDMEIAFYGEFIQYVNIEADEALQVDGVTLSITESALKKAFGQPDYTAEDGIVFQRDDAVLKLFFDEATREPQYVSYYHIATV